MQDESSSKDSVLESDGCFIHYWLVGDQSRPLVTFIHGAGADHHIFDTQITELIPFFCLLLWDMPGQGQSQQTTKVFSIRDAREYLIALLDHLGYAQTALVGISLGGTIAQEVVLCFPERVTALVVIGTPCSTLTLTPVTKLMLWIFMLFMRRAPIEAIRLFHKFFASVNQDARTYVYQAFCRVSEKTHRRLWEAFNEVFCLGTALPDYRIPHSLLLIDGEHENVWNKWLMTRWVRFQPDCCYAIIPKAGHLANWDGRDHFNHILIDFLLKYCVSTLK